ncbi:MAG: ribulose-phosphate 3-epimerase [bacterium]
MSIQIAPSILSADFSRLAEEVTRVEKAGAELLHIDVMDGHFVPNITLGAPIVKCLKGKTGLPFDVHLMIERPDFFLNDFADSGADYITVHAEAATHLHRTVMAIKELGVKAGVALNPATPLSCLEYILDELDMVLLMSVNPGFGGQKFIEAVLPKVRELKQMIAARGLKTLIEIDGGVNVSNAGRLAEAGADILVAGSAVYKSDDVAEAIAGLKQAAV